MKSEPWILSFINELSRKLDLKAEKERDNEGLTLFLEVVVALEATTEPINGLPSLSNPESNSVNGFP